MPDPPVITYQLLQNEDVVNNSEVGVENSAVVANRKGKNTLPICSVSLRRGTRSNKYDGFKVPAITDSKPRSSKVKPRINPSAKSSVVITELDDTTEAPPPTPIATIHLVGTVKCAIPAAELSEDALNEVLEDNPSASSSA